MLYPRAPFPGLPHKAVYAVPLFRRCLIMPYTRAPVSGLPHKAIYAALCFRGYLIRPDNKQNTVYVLSGPENTKKISTDLLMWSNTHWHTFLHSTVPKKRFY